MWQGRDGDISRPLTLRMQKYGIESEAQLRELKNSKLLEKRLDDEMRTQDKEEEETSKADALPDSQILIETNTNNETLI